MKIMISPALRMKDKEEFFEPKEMPVLFEYTKELIKYLKSLSFSELKELLACNDQIAGLNFERYQNMRLEQGPLPALFAFDGIQYQTMCPHLFEERCYLYLEKHLRILSGLYGILRPFDGIWPYRLEMQAKCKTKFCKNLYDFWADKIYQELAKSTDVIVNLSSKEYRRIIEPYLDSSVHFVTCRFVDVNEGRWIEKSVYVKMARGAMVRFMAENHITDVEKLKEFQEFGYVYSKKFSSYDVYVFIK